MNTNKQQQSNYNISSNNNLNFDELYELAALSDFVFQSDTNSNLLDIKLVDLYQYLKNPERYYWQIRMASRYLVNKHGIIKDILNSMKSLPTLKYHLSWSSFDDVKKIQKYEKKIYDFLDNIVVKKVVRDGLFEVGELGTVVLCVRNNKYIQFLDLNDLHINRQENGRWVVEFDLQKLVEINDKSAWAIEQLQNYINALPDEVTMDAYDKYRKGGTQYRYLVLKNCYVVNIGASRNSPYGLPYHFGAWYHLLQKEIVNRVERSVFDRVIKQILILYAGNIGGKDGKPAPKKLIEGYFRELSNLMLKKEQSSSKGANGEMSGTGVIALPDFFKVEPLKIDLSLFTKDLYNKIDNDIFANLGVSSALVYGGGDGSNYASAQLNTEKFFRIIFNVIEDFEYIINDIIQKMLPRDLSCKFFFERSTILDKDKMVDRAKEFYMQTGIWTPWAEAMFDIPYHYVLGMAKYEREVLKIQDYIAPAANAYTQSGSNDGAGRPSNDSPDNPNTIKHKSSGSGSLPSPSD